MAGFSVESIMNIVACGVILIATLAVVLGRMKDAMDEYKAEKLKGADSLEALNKAVHSISTKKSKRKKEK